MSADILGSSEARLGELLDDAPAWETEAMVCLIHDCWSWTDGLPCPSDPAEFRVRLIAGVTELDGHLVAMKELMGEWSSASRKPSTFRHGKEALDAERRRITEAQSTLRAGLSRVNQELRAVKGKDVIGNRGRLIRAVDNALELWRDDPSRAQEILAELDDAMDDYYGENPHEIELLGGES